MKKINRIFITTIILGGLIFYSHSSLAQIIPTKSPMTAAEIADFNTLNHNIEDFKTTIVKYKTSGITAVEKQSLLKRIADLRTKITLSLEKSKAANSSTNSSSNSSSGTQITDAFCHTFYRSVNPDDGGNDVIALEEILYNAGFGRTLNSEGIYSGVLNPALLARVKAFQTSKGITPAGAVGPLTRVSLNALYGCGDNDKITVLWPRGNVVKRGNNITFQWVTNGAFGVKKIALVPEMIGGSEILALNQTPLQYPLTTNTYTWKIPANVPLGNYRIRVTVGYDVVSDLSTRAFTIINSESIVPPPPAPPEPAIKKPVTTATPSPTTNTVPVITPTPSSNVTQTTQTTQASSSPTPTVTPTPSTTPHPTTSP